MAAWCTLVIFTLSLTSTLATIFPPDCPSTGCSGFLPQSVIDGTCNNRTFQNRYYYNRAPHYVNKTTFLSNAFSKLTPVVVTGTVSDLYRQNYTENLVPSGQTVASKVTQEYYMVDITLSCVLKHERYPSQRHFFPLPNPVFLKSDCPPRGITVGDNVIVSMTANHNTICSQKCWPVHWSFYGYSLHKRDSAVLDEIMKTCGFQKPSKPEGRGQNVCPSVSVSDKTCVNRDSGTATKMPSLKLVLVVVSCVLYSLVN